jgi:hypothetical protein
MLEAESEQIPQVSLKTHRYSLEPRLLTFNLNVSWTSIKMFSNKACRMSAALGTRRSKRTTSRQPSQLASDSLVADIKRQGLLHLRT